MKAVIYDRFGDVTVLRLADASIADPGKGEVQVRTAAVSVNPLDGKIRRGEMRLMSGSKFPKRTGQDFAGTISAIGPGVENWRIGDPVFGLARGMKDGALAEFVNVPVGNVSPAPTSMTATESAAVPMVALAAYQAVTNVGRVKAGSHVLINGASGGVGLYAVQFARFLNASVTATATGPGIELVRNYGADIVVDYRSNELSTLNTRFDTIIDLSGKLSFREASQHLLAPTGSFIDLTPSPRSLVMNTLANPFRRRKHRFLLSKPDRAILEQIARRIDNGEIRTPPNQTFPLNQYQDAYRTAETGGLLGKVTITIE
jgi:NADPH:quinone reductase-like Zn-dependent oxidoreductase